MDPIRIRLDDTAVGERLDRALVAALERDGHPCTRSHLARAFENGGVTGAGGARLKPGRVVEAAQEVQVTLPEPEPLRAEPEDIPLRVLHEDDALLVVDKPAGMVVHAGPGHPRGTLVNAVLHHLGVGPDALPVLPGNDATRPGIVHRLDRETSGSMVIAKHARAQEALAAQFRVHDLERVYVGFVAGVPAPPEQRIETPHARDPGDRRRFSATAGGKRTAITHLRVVRGFGVAARTEFRLETGRTHQIRIHAAHLGHPILADGLYGRKPRDPALARAVEPLDRHALHAAVLGFRHPQSGAQVRFEAPLPPELVALEAALARMAGA